MLTYTCICTCVYSCMRELVLTAGTMAFAYVYNIKMNACYALCHCETYG